MGINTDKFQFRRTDGIRFRRAESSKKVLIILKNRIIENKNVEKTP